MTRVGDIMSSSEAVFDGNGIPPVRSGTLSVEKSEAAVEYGQKVSRDASQKVDFTPASVRDGDDASNAEIQTTKKENLPLKSGVESLLLTSEELDQKLSQLTDYISQKADSINLLAQGQSGYASELYQKIDEIHLAFSKIKKSIGDIQTLTASEDLASIKTQIEALVADIVASSEDLFGSPTKYGVLRNLEKDASDRIATTEQKVSNLGSTPELDELLQYQRDIYSQVGSDAGVLYSIFDSRLRPSISQISQSLA